MNPIRRLLLFIGCGVFAICALFPPRTSADGERPLSRRFLFSEYLYKADYFEWNVQDDGQGVRSFQRSYTEARVALDRLVAEVFLLLAFMGVAALLPLRTNRNQRVTEHRGFEVRPPSN